MSEDAGHRINASTLRLLLGLAAAVVILVGMRFASELIVSLFFAYIIVVIASPLLNWLVAKGLPKWLAFILTLAAVVLSITGLLLVIVSGISRFTADLPQYLLEAEGLTNSLNQLLATISFGQVETSALSEIISFGQILRWFGSFLTGLMDTVSSILLIGLFTVFMLVQVFSTPQKMRQEIARGNRYVLRLYNYGSDLRRYILITTIIGLVTGGLDTILFLILGIPNPLLWGFIAFVLSFVPTIGFWLAAIPPTIIGLLVGGPLLGIGTLFGILAINGFADNIVKPKFVGDGLDLSPFMVIFSVVFWSFVLGAAGSILGVPMTMLFKEVILETDDHQAWIAYLMGSANRDADPTSETGSE